MFSEGENGIRCVPLNTLLHGKKIATASNNSANATPTIHFVDVSKVDKDEGANLAACEYTFTLCMGDGFLGK